MSVDVFSATGVIAGLYVVGSVTSFGLFGFDKFRAQNNGWRVPERTLLVSALCFGWPGALAARRAFRHKTRKQPFGLILYTIVGAHVLGWALWFWLR